MQLSTNIDTDTAPSVGIIVLNWNGKADTLECLTSLFNCSYPYFHVYVVDNASSDDSVSAVTQQFSERRNITLIENSENFGFAGGNNIGMRRAMEDGMDYVLLLNNDTVVDERFLDPLVQTLESDKAIGVVTSKIYFIEPSKSIWFFGGFMDRNTGIGGPIGGGQEDIGQFNENVDCDYATGCVLMVRSTLLNKIGLLDEDYFYLCEDADFCFRVANAGLRIVAIAKSLVWHKVSASLSGGEESPVRLYFRARNQMLLVAKNKKNFSWYKQGIFLLNHHLIYLLRRTVKGMPFIGSWFYIKGLCDFMLGKIGNIPEMRND